MALKSALRTVLKLNSVSQNLRSFNRHANFLILNSGASSRFLHVCIPLQKKQEVTIVIRRDEQEILVKGKEGDSILDVIVDNNIDIPGYGACEGTLSCSTCHIKLSTTDFEKISLGASDEELDMLDLAPDVSPTSRLGCQIVLSKDLEGLKVEVPSEVKDMREVPRVSV